MKETSDPPSVISTTDRDLDDFVTKPGPSKIWNQRTTWRRARSHSVDAENLHWLARWE